MNFQELLAILLTSDEPDRRRSIALELAGIKELPEEAISALARGVSDSDKGVRDVCAYALSNVPQQDTALKARYIAPLIIHRNIEIRNLAGEVLVRLGAGAADVLLPFLDDQDPDTRKFACDVIALLGNSGDHILQAVVRLTDDPDSNVRTAAVDALGRLGASRYLPVLLDMYDSDEEMQPYIIQSLGLIGGERAQEFLLNILTLPDEFLQIAAIDAIALCGNDISIAFRILQALPGATDEVQLIMLRTIFGLSYRLGTPILLPDELRHVAHRALTDSDEEIRIAGLFALGQELRHSDIGPLLEFTRHSEDNLRLHVLSLVLACPDPDTIAEFFRQFLYLLDSDSPQMHDMLFLLPSAWETAPHPAQVTVLAVLEQRMDLVSEITRRKLAEVLTELPEPAARRLYTT